MIEYACWFCGEGIDATDTGAVMIVVQNLSRWASGRMSDDDPMQQVYSHARCAKQHLRGVTMELEPEVFGEEFD